MFMTDRQYLCVAVRHQRNVHDFSKHEPGREEALGKELSAAGTQALVVEGHLDWICLIMLPVEV